jgi:hypothetical protein
MNNANKTDLSVTSINNLWQYDIRFLTGPSLEIYRTQFASTLNDCLQLCTSQNQCESVQYAQQRCSLYNTDISRSTNTNAQRQSSLLTAIRSIDYGLLYVINRQHFV